MALTLTYPDGGMLVTGGTGNVGSGIVRQLAKAGVPVVFTYRSNKVKADELAAELNDAGARAWAQPMDMADTSSIHAAIDRVIGECGNLHGLAAGAGVTVGFNNIMDFAVEDAVRFVNADALGYFRLFHAVTPVLRRRGGGTITTCSTMATQKVIAFDGISPLSKGSVDALVRQIAAEEGRNGIRCNAVAIGWIEERIADFAQVPPKPDVEPADEAGRIMVLVRQLVDSVKLGRSGRPEEAGNLFAFLASNEASYLTGQIIAIDGGITL